MFTGIIEILGVVESGKPVAGGTRLRIGCGAIGKDLETGQSIAVDGVCLTVTAHGAGWFEAEIGPETVRRSTLGKIKPGRQVNLERPLRVDARLGGHFVQGHVDGTTAVRSVRRAGEFVDLVLAAPAALRGYLVEKGSVAINGVSLTVAAVGRGTFAMALVPHTLKMTNLSSLRRGARVNVEVDILAKYVESLVSR